MVIRKPCYFYVRSTMGILASVLIAPCCTSLFKKHGMGPDERSIKHHGSIKSWELRSRCTPSPLLSSGFYKTVYIDWNYETTCLPKNKTLSSQFCSLHILIHTKLIFLTHPDQLSLGKYTCFIHKRDRYNLKSRCFPCHLQKN